MARTEMWGRTRINRGLTKPRGAMPLLVAYYGVFQTGHLILNVVYLFGLRPIEDFPPPPAEGWHPQAIALWTSMGLIDTGIALLALYFAAAYLGGRRGVLWAGLVSLTTYAYNTFTFNYSLVATGAWALHPVEYVVINALSIPLLLLFVMVVREVREAAGPEWRRRTSWR